MMKKPLPIAVSVPAAIPGCHGVAGDQQVLTEAETDDRDQDASCDPGGKQRPDARPIGCEAEEDELGSEAEAGDQAEAKPMAVSREDPAAATAHQPDGDDSGDDPGHDQPGREVTEEDAPHHRPRGGSYRGDGGDHGDVAASESGVQAHHPDGTADACQRSPQDQVSTEAAVEERCDGEHGDGPGDVIPSPHRPGVGPTTRQTSEEVTGTRKRRRQAR